MNWKSLVLFEIAFKAALATAFTLMGSLGFRLAMGATGRSYLTRESFGTFLAHPLTLLLLALLTLLAVACAMIDLSAVVYILNCSSQNFRCRMRQILRFSLFSLP